MVTLTESAASKIKELVAQEPEGEANIFRIAVTGGGCSGFQYELGFDRGPQDGDNEIEMHGVRVAIDPFSAPYLVGSQVDFVHALMGQASRSTTRTWSRPAAAAHRSRRRTASARGSPRRRMRTAAAAARQLVH